MVMQPRAEASRKLILKPSQEGGSILLLSAYGAERVLDRLNSAARISGTMVDPAGNESGFPAEAPVAGRRPSFAQSAG